MARKTETQVLTEAVRDLTLAVKANTQTLGQALGKSSKDMEDIAKQLAAQDRQEIPRDAGPQEILERMAGRLAPGFDLQAYTNEAAQEIGEGHEDKTVLARHQSRPLFGGLLQNAAENARAERDRQTEQLRQGEDYAGQRYGDGQASDPQAETGHEEGGQQ